MASNDPWAEADPRWQPWQGPVNDSELFSGTPERDGLKRYLSDLAEQERQSILKKYYKATKIDYEQQTVKANGLTQKIRKRNS